MTQKTDDYRSLVPQFRSDGYVAIPEFLSAAEIAELRLNVQRFIDEVAPTMPREEVFYEDKNDRGSLKQLQRMFARDEYFRKLMLGSRFEKLATTLLESDVKAINLQYFNKPPGTGKATPAHQDGFYFMLEPNEAVTMWLALDEIDEQNGCVRYVRGSHLHGMRPHGKTQTLGFSQGLLDFGSDADRRNEVAFPASPGDLLVHHALTVHRADANQSCDRTRQALGFVYFSAAAKENPEKDQRHDALLKELRRSGKL